MFLLLPFPRHTGYLPWKPFCFGSLANLRGCKLVQIFFFNFYLFIYFIYFWPCWVFVSVWGLSPVAASGGHSSSRCTGLSPSRPLLLWSTGSRRAGSVVVAHGPSCSAACGILPDQGSNPHPPHWQADSQPLCHQGSPGSNLANKYILVGTLRVLKISRFLEKNLLPLPVILLPTPLICLSSENTLVGYLCFRPSQFWGGCRKRNHL